MAFRQTLCRAAGNKHISSYGSVLDRFLISNAPSTSTAAPASLFEPTKNASTGCWHPPKYSLRRQAKLVREAALTGQLPLLPDGPKTARLTQRLQRLQKTHAFEQTAKEYQYVPKETSAEVKGTRIERLGERVVKPRQRISEEDKEQALRAARDQVRGVGPYSGRAKIFKGSRVDKDRSKRSEDVKAKLGNMEGTKKDWQSTQTEAKNKLKPGLPF